MKNLSNQERAAESKTNLEKKRRWLLDLVTTVADGQPLAGKRFPVTMQEFREFEDPELDLKRIGSPKLLDKRQSPQRRNLIDEIEGYLATLATYKLGSKPRKKKPSLTTQLATIKAERDDLKYLVGRLVSQVATLLKENHNLRAGERAFEKLSLPDEYSPN